MKYAVRHHTSYRYTAPVTLCHNQVHVLPRELPRQRCLSWRLETNPQPLLQRHWVDYFGNLTRYCMTQGPYQELSIVSTGIAEVLPFEVSSDVVHIPWEQTREVASAAGRTAAMFRLDSPHIRRSDEAREYAIDSFAAGRSLYEAVIDLTDRIYSDFTFSPTSTTINTPVSEVFRHRRGVCQDFAHVQIACLRSLGLAARYVSGYLLTHPPAGMPRRVGADASHAWVGVYFPGYGWIDFDPTNNVVVGMEHIVVAWGRDYSDVCPVRGVFLGGGNHTLEVLVDVEPLPEPELAT